MPDALAPPVAAACIAVLGVLGGGLWLGRAAGARGAFLLGPLLLLATPEVAVYAQRAWGSLAEGLALLPWLALGLERHLRRPRPASALGLGIALGLAAVVSYVHAITALAGLAILLRRPRDAALAAVAASGTFALWLLAAVPHREEALVVRGGHPLPTLLAPAFTRLPRALVELPAAFAGAGRSDALRIVAGAALAGLAAAALVRAWRRGGPLRWLPIVALASLAAFAAGLQLADPPEALRYALPLLVVSAAALAAWPRAAAAALVVALALPPPPPAGQPPHAVHAQLGANAQDRVRAEPHAKIQALWRVTDPWARPWLLYGYGVDQGRRHRRVVDGMAARLAEVGGDRSRVAGNPHFALLEPPAWVAWARPLGGAPEHAAFLFGLGVGMGEAGDAAEDFLAAIEPSEAAIVRLGLAGGDAPAPLSAYRTVELRRDR